MEYRIREFGGLFSIQAKRVTKKTTGYLWWEKITEETEWIGVDSRGFARWSFREIISTPPVYYDNLELARAACRKFNDGPIYHEV